MELPTVSAIVATHNYAHFLRETLESALAQDYPADRLEVVVVDDGSTDGTAALLEELAARYPGRLRWLRQENQGYVAATNRAISLARGELLALLDGDDVWLPEKTQRQVELFLKNPRLGLAYGDLTVVDAAGQVLQPSHWQHKGLVPLRGAGHLPFLIVRHNVATASSIMVRAALAPHFHPIPPTVHYVDWWLALRVCALAELDYLSEPCIHYRFHGSNLTMEASGRALGRERRKEALTRRTALLEDGWQLLPDTALWPAWRKVEQDLLEAAVALETPFLDWPKPTPEERELASHCASHGQALVRRGRSGEGLRYLVRALALNPDDRTAREAAEAAAGALQAGQPGLDLLAGAHPFTALTALSTVVARPQVLARFEEQFGAAEATLVIYAPGSGPQETAASLERALAAVGLDGNLAAHLLALPDTERQLDFARLAAAVDTAGDEHGFALLARRYAALAEGSARVAPSRPSNTASGSTVRRSGPTSTSRSPSSTAAAARRPS